MHLTPTQQSLHEARKARMARIVGAGVPDRAPVSRFRPVEFKRATPPPPPSKPVVAEYKPLNFLRIDDEIEPTIGAILRATGQHYGISVFELTSSRRTRRLAAPRHVAMYVATQLTRRSLPHIGRLMGNRDHTTILHGRNKIASLLSVHPELQADVEAIKAIVRVRG